MIPGGEPRVSVYTRSDGSQVKREEWADGLVTIAYRADEWETWSAPEVVVPVVAEAVAS